MPEAQPDLPMISSIIVFTSTVYTVFAVAPDPPKMSVDPDQWLPHRSTIAFAAVASAGVPESTAWSEFANTLAPLFAPRLVVLKTSEAEVITAPAGTSSSHSMP